MNQDAPPAAKRPKIRLACRECRDRKIRCDGGRPLCNACARKKLGPAQCVYAGPSIETSPDYVRSLETRIRELEYSSGGQSRWTPSLPLPAPSLQPLHMSSAETLATLRYRPTNNHPVVPQIAYSESQAEIHVALPGAAPQPRGIDSVLVDSGAAVTHQPDHRPAPTDVMPHQTDHRAMQMEPQSNEISHDSRPTSLPTLDSRDSGARPHHERSIMGVEGLVEADSETHEGGRSVFLGRSSAAAFISEVRGNSSKRRRGDDGVKVPSTNSPASQSSRLSRRAELDIADLMQQLLLPPRRVADHHLQFYWKYIYPFNPIMHKATFQQRYEEIWSQNLPTISSPSGSSPETEDADAIRAFYGLFNILIALGSLHSTPSREVRSASSKAVTGDTFFDRAEHLLSERTMSHNTILSVQAYILMAHYLQITGNVNKCWVMVGTAIRTAQGLGIHLNPVKESQAEQQERRRTWSFCLQMDRILGMMFGRPPMVAWPTLSDPVPALADDEMLSMEPYSSSQPIPTNETSVLGYFVHSVRYSEILLEVLKIVYTQDAAKITHRDGFHLETYFELLRLDSLIAEWYSQLPPHLVARADEDFIGESTVLSQAVAMLCRYLHLKMLLFRSVAVEAAKGNLLEPAADASHSSPTNLQQSVILGCVHSCIFAAQDIIRATHTRCVRMNPGRLPNWWYPTFYIFTAGTVILAVLISRDRQALHPSSATPLEVIWRQAMEVLAVYEDQGRPFARQCAWTLQTALDQGLRDAMSEPRGTFRISSFLKAIAPNNWWRIKAAPQPATQDDAREKEAVEMIGPGSLRIQTTWDMSMTTWLTRFLVETGGKQED